MAALPFLPGNTFNPNVGKEYFAKPHHFDFNNFTTFLIDKNRPNHSVLPKGAGSALPTWVAFDKQVLSFDGYFEEASKTKRGEYTVHQCKVYFYLEDDTIQVVEPKNQHGSSQAGSVIRRHRIPRPPPNDKTFYTLEDFNLGVELPMYGRNVKICNCDEFTRNFLRKIGVRINEPVSAPGDPYSEARKGLEGFKNPYRPYERVDTLKQFLGHDRHVLRFYCYWDDTMDNQFGDPRHMILHYYLADDTIEIREVIPQNSGRDAVPMFLHRGKLPKQLEQMKKPGELADRTVLNVFGPMGKGGRYILDNRKVGDVKQDYYTDSDLQIGALVNVWGRNFLIVDCDEFTKEYYRTKYGITDFTPIQIRKKESENTAGCTVSNIEAESDNGVKFVAINPTTIPAKRSFTEFMNNGADKRERIVLRFLAKLDSKKGVDVDRRFIISCFLTDDTICVYEPPIRNSGIIGGKFLERSKIEKPNQTVAPGKKPKYYTGRDLCVGASVELNRHKFILIDADQYALNYMEQQCHEYPQSDIRLVMEKLSQLTQDAGLENIVRKLEQVVYLPTAQFYSFIKDISNNQLLDQEMICLARYYEDREKDRISIDALLWMLHEQMKRNCFDEYNFIRDKCLHFDGNRSGRLNPERIRTVFRSVKVPVQDDMLRAFLNGLAAENGDGLVDYNKLVRMLNWRSNPVVQQIAIDTTTPAWSEDSWFGSQPTLLVQKVNALALLQDLLGNERS